jgi:integrase/recombinase XerD
MIALNKAIEGYILDITTTYSESTIKMYQLLLQQFARKVDGDRPLDQIGSEDLKRYMLFMKTEYIPRRVRGSTRIGNPLSASAIDNIWKCLRSFFKWASNNLEVANPAEGLARPKFTLNQIIPYTQEEVKRLVDAAQYYYTSAEKRRRRRPAGHRNLAVILVLLDTGIRVGELSRIKYADTRLDVGEIHITSFGTGRKTKGRTVFLGQVTRKDLWRYMSTISDPRPGDSLFGLTPKSIRQLLLHLGAAAKVPSCHPHRFRHTFAIEYLRNGGDVYTLQRILGHSTLEMVHHYLNIIATDLQAAHRRASPTDNWKL